MLYATGGLAYSRSWGYRRASMSTRRSACCRPEWRSRRLSAISTAAARITEEACAGAADGLAGPSTIDYARVPAARLSSRRRRSDRVAIAPRRADTAALARRRSRAVGPAAAKLPALAILQQPTPAAAATKPSPMRRQQRRRLGRHAQERDELVPVQRDRHLRLCTDAFIDCGPCQRRMAR